MDFLIALLTAIALIMLTSRKSIRDYFDPPRTGNCQVCDTPTNQYLADCQKRGCPYAWRGEHEA